MDLLPRASAHNQHNVSFHTRLVPVAAGGFDRSSVFASAVISSVVTVVCACAAVLCVLVTFGRRQRRRQTLRDGLGQTAEAFWKLEDDVTRLLGLVVVLRSKVAFRNVSYYDLFAYKVRVENGVFGDATGRPPASPFITLKTLEHLLERLALCLPTSTSVLTPTDRTTSVAFGASLCRTVGKTAQVWCDDLAPTVRRVFRQLGGAAAVEAFDCRRESDASLETRVLSQVPYVRSLRLLDAGDRFQLNVDDIVADVELRRRIVDVDRCLGGDERALVGFWTDVQAAYVEARDICVNSGLIRRGIDFPDLSGVDVGQQQRPMIVGVVVLLRHLFRSTCGVATNFRRLQDDERFRRFVTQLQQRLVGGADATVRLAERSRDNVIAYATALTVDLALVDGDFTKATLEHVERQLGRHADQLASRLASVDPAASAARQQTHRSARVEIEVEGAELGELLLPSSMPGPSGYGRVGGGGLVRRGSAERSSVASGMSLYATAVSTSPANGEELESLLTVGFGSAVGDDGDFLETAL